MTNRTPPNQYGLPLGANPRALTDHVPAGKVDTSREAFEGQKVKRAADQNRVLFYIYQRGDGATCSEAEVALDLLHQTASARFNDLFRAGLIERRGERRATHTGSTAFVWTLTPMGVRTVEGW